jgi:hypothetical protein
MTNSKTRTRALVLSALLALFAFAATASSAFAKTKTVRVALKPNGHEVPNNNAEYIAASSDGRFWAFESTGKLSPKDHDNGHDVYVYDRKKRKNTLVSVKSNGNEGNADCAAADISPNARYVSFSCEGELAGNDQNDRADIYRHDRKTGKTILISVKSDGSQVNGIDDDSIISGVADNGVVAWESHGAFVNDDTNDSWDVFVRNPKAGTTKRASLDSDGNQLPNGVNSLGPTKQSKVPISASGRTVAFVTDDKATSDTDYANAVDSDVFIRNLGNNTTQRVSLKQNGEEADPNNNANSRTPSISADGRYVAFQASPDASFVAADANNGYDVYVKDRKTGKITLASAKSNGSAVPNADAQFPEISPNGRFVAWDGFADFGGPADPANGRDVYRHDMNSGKTVLVSATFKGLRGDDNQLPDPSSNGWVGFQSLDQLTPAGDDGMDWDVFLRGPLG